MSSNLSGAADSTPEGRAALRDLHTALVDQFSLDLAASDAVQLAAPIDTEDGPPPGWSADITAIADALGLRITWRLASPADIAEEIQNDLPAVSFEDGSWQLVTRRGAQLWTRRFPGGPLGRPWLAERASEVTRAWALLEPALPGDVLGGPAGVSPLTRLWGLLRAEREDLRTVVIFAVAVGLLALATPVAVQVLVNTVAFGAIRQPLLALGLVLLLCLSAAAVLKVLQRYTVEVLQRRLFVRMVADLAERLPRVRSDAHDRTHLPELVNRFFDVVTVQKSMSSLLLDGLGASLQAVVGMMLLALYHPALLGFDLVLVLAIVSLIALGRGAQDAAIVESKRKYAVAAWLEEVAAHPEVFKLGGAQMLAATRSDDLAQAWIDARHDHFRRYFRQYGAALAIQALANTALLTVGGWLVIERQLSLGQLVAAEFIVASVLIGVAKFADKLETIYDLIAAVDKLGQLVAVPLDATVGSRRAPANSPARLDAVAVTVDGGAVQPRPLDFTIAPMERVAMLGPEEAGLAVAADLLAGLRPPSGGRLMRDNVDVCALHATALRRDAALLRTPQVIAATLLDNVALGRPDITREDVLAALDAVGFRPAARGLDEGLDARIGEGTGDLTDSDRARIAVARAVAGRPHLIVVDRLLDRVDPPTREVLLRALSPEQCSWTLVVLTTQSDTARMLSRVIRLREAATPIPLSPPE